MELSVESPPLLVLVLVSEYVLLMRNFEVVVLRNFAKAPANRWDIRVHPQTRRPGLHPSSLLRLTRQRHYKQDQPSIWRHPLSLSLWLSGSLALSPEPGGGSVRPPLMKQVPPRPLTCTDSCRRSPLLMWTDRPSLSFSVFKRKFQIPTSCELVPSENCEIFHGAKTTVPQKTCWGKERERRDGREREREREPAKPSLQRRQLFPLGTTFARTEDRGRGPLARTVYSTSRWRSPHWRPPLSVLLLGPFFLGSLKFLIQAAFSREKFLTVACVSLSHLHHGALSPSLSPQQRQQHCLHQRRATMSKNSLEWEHIMKRAAPGSLQPAGNAPVRPASAAAATISTNVGHPSATQAYLKDEVLRVRGFRQVKVTREGRENGGRRAGIGKRSVSTSSASSSAAAAAAASATASRLSPPPAASSSRVTAPPSPPPAYPPPAYDSVVPSHKRGSFPQTAGDSKTRPPPPAYADSFPPAAPSSAGSVLSSCSSRTTTSSDGGVLRPRDYKPPPPNVGKRKQVSFRITRSRSTRSTGGTKPKGTPAQRSIQRTASASAISRPTRHHANGGDGERSSRGKGRHVTVAKDGADSSRARSKEEVSPAATRSSLRNETSPSTAPPVPPPNEVSMDVADLILGNFGGQEGKPSPRDSISKPMLVEDEKSDRPPATVPSNPERSHRPSAGSRKESLARPGAAEGRTTDASRVPSRRSNRHPEAAGQPKKSALEGNDRMPADWRERSPSKVVVVGADGWAGLANGARSSNSK